MRVLHVIPTIGPRYGGPSIACLELCKALALRGLEVTIYTTDIDLPEQFRDGKLGETLVEGVRVNVFRAIGPTYYWLSPQLFSALNENVAKFDIVHIHSLYRIHLPITVHYCKKYRVPYVIKPHGTLDPYLFVRRRWRKILHELLFERPALKGAAAVQFTAEEEQVLAGTTSVFEHGTGYHNVIIPNGVVIPEGMEILRGMNMHADYVNLIKADVDVEIYSNYNNDENVIRKDKELRSKQTFCVRYSGNIMHSGPGGKAMEECYYVFIGLMKYLRPYIEIKDKR